MDWLETERAQRARSQGLWMGKAIRLPDESGATPVSALDGGTYDVRRAEYDLWTSQLQIIAAQRACRMEFRHAGCVIFSGVLDALVSVIPRSLRIRMGNPVKEPNDAVSRQHSRRLQVRR